MPACDAQRHERTRPERRALEAEGPRGYSSSPRRNLPVHSEALIPTPLRSGGAAALVILAALAAPAPSPAEALEPPAFEEPLKRETTAGTVLLVWGDDTPTGALYELQESDAADLGEPRIRYRGPATRTFLSGLLDGSYHYRVRARSRDGAPWSAWSQPLVLEVRHHPLPLTFALFGLGAVVFALTAGLLLRHDTQVRREGKGRS